MRPLVISSATPRATYMTPSVATKAGTLKTGDEDAVDRAHERAERQGQDHHGPDRRVEDDAQRRSISTPFISAPATTPQSPRTEPTDRSMPPFRITSSMPMARRP